MKKLLAGSRYRLLGFVIALALTVAALSSSTAAAGDWSGCGDPYIKTVTHCITIPTWWGALPLQFCWDSDQGCADCDQGTACYSL
jgi:hypothetical protein